MEKKKKLLDEIIADIITDDAETSNIKEKVSLIKAAFLKITYPDQFCPECESQLLSVEGNQKCFNCGYVKKQKAEAIQQKPVSVNNNKERKKEIPKAVDNLINTAGRTSSPSKAGSSIQELVNQSKSGNIGPATAADTNNVKRGDSNISDVNWL